MPVINLKTQLLPCGSWCVKEFEKRMSKFEGPEMKRIDPELEEDQ